jgi:hypothetical protein
MNQNLHNYDIFSYVVNMIILGLEHVQNTFSLDCYQTH